MIVNAFKRCNHCNKLTKLPAPNISRKAEITCSHCGKTFTIYPPKQKEISEEPTPEFKPSRGMCGCGSGECSIM